jgi:hypothetical protein
MSRHEKIEALSCVIDAKVAELGFGAEAKQALEEWHADVAAAPAAREPSAVKAVEVRRLVRFLESVHLSEVCFLIPGPPDPDIREASMRLLAKLRDLHAAAQHEGASLAYA